MTDFTESLYDGQPCANGQRKDRHPLLVERESLEFKYLTTGEGRQAYLDADRKCRELGLLPKTKSE